MTHLAPTASGWTRRYRTVPRVVVPTGVPLTGVGPGHRRGPGRAHRAIGSLRSTPASAPDIDIPATTAPQKAAADAGGRTASRRPAAVRPAADPTRPARPIGVSQ